MVAELREAPGKAENFKWKEFKAYHGGVLVVRSTRLHKVITRCTRSYVPALCHALLVGLGCARGHSADPTRRCKAPDERASWALCVRC